MRLAVVDDHPLVRQGITYLFSVEADMEVAGEAGSIEEGLAVINQKRPDLVLVDLKLMNENGLELVRRAKAKEQNCKFVILTSSCDRNDFLKATQLGVDGYLLKDALPEEILAAVRLVARGRKYYAPGLLELLLQKDEDNVLKGLSEREKEVLRLLGQGLNNKQIAQSLFIAESTVKKHVSQLLSKLNLADRTQAALFMSSRRLAN